MKVKVAWLNQIQGFLLAWIWWVWPNPSIFREMFSNPSIFEEIHILTLKNSRIWYFPSYFHATFTYRNASAQIFDQFDTLDHTVEGAYLDAKINGISSATLWHSTAVTTLMLICILEMTKKSKVWYVMFGILISWINE